MNSEIVRLSTLMARFDQLDASLAQIRLDNTRAVESIEKLRIDHDRELEKVRLGDLEALNRAIGEVRKGLEPIPELRKSVQAAWKKISASARLIEEMEMKVVEARRSDEEYRRAQKLLEEGQRQEAKRLADLQGEVTAMRKRLDEQRGKVDLLNDSLRKFDVRINELQVAESERRQAQTAFVDKQNMAYVERERIWKDWQIAL